MDDRALYEALSPEQRALLDGDGVVVRGLPEGVWNAELDYVAPKIVKFDDDEPAVKLGWHWIVELEGGVIQHHEITTSMATGRNSTFAKIVAAIAPDLYGPGADVKYAALANRRARLAVVPNADGGMDVTYMKAGK